MTERTTDALGDEELFGAECDYDPLEEFEEKDLDEKAETFGYKATPEEVEAQTEAAAQAGDDSEGCAKPQAPARERIERLFEDMIPYKNWFLAILDACREAQDAAGVGKVVEGLQSRRRCVYATANFLAMLQDAGALEKLTRDGEPYAEVEPQLMEVVEDGKTYLRPTPPPEAMWRTTADGLEALADNDPLGTLVGIVREHAAYTDVFREILGLCDGDGSSIGNIKEQVNSNPALEYPKKSAQFFMDYLDRNGAIEWDGAWKITEVGRQLLGKLEDC